MVDAARDTQWMRFEVFLQERPDQPHRSVGSVHAPDAEIALQNARDVFVRRPRAHSLWVAPARAILARTQQELEADDADQVMDVTHEGGVAERYQVFQKQSQRRSKQQRTQDGRKKNRQYNACIEVSTDESICHTVDSNHKGKLGLSSHGEPHDGTISPMILSVQFGCH